MDLSSDESTDENFINDIMNQEVEDEQHQLLLAIVDLVYGDDEDEPAKRGGSLPGKAKNINRNRQLFDLQLNADYFDENPTYDLPTFRRRFRMRRELFLQIEERLQQSYRFFTQRADATGMLGISCRQKVVTAIRMLATGCSGDDVDDRSRIAESTMLEILDCFCNAIIEQYSGDFLREPSAEDLAIILQKSEENGWPGMLGSIDCMHWKWKNCPKAWAGMYKGQKDAPTIVLQAIADSECRIWHHYFGLPGSCNDINVLERSDLLHSVMNGDAPRIRFNVNGNEYSMGYWLADGIYQQLACIVKAYKPPYIDDIDKKKKFTKHQESRRKDVERCFGILKQRWQVLTRPCKFWRADNIDSMMKACILLHNMIINDERAPAAEPVAGNNNAFAIDPPVNHQQPDEVNQYRILLLQHVANENVHHSLRRDLTEHVWDFFPDEPEEIAVVEDEFE